MTDTEQNIKWSSNLIKTGSFISLFCIMILEWPAGGHVMEDIILMRLENFKTTCLNFFNTASISCSCINAVSDIYIWCISNRKLEKWSKRTESGDWKQRKKVGSSWHVCPYSPLFSMYEVSLYDFSMYEVSLYGFSIYEVSLYGFSMYEASLYGISMYEVSLYGISMYRVATTWSRYVRI